MTATIAAIQSLAHAALYGVMVIPKRSYSIKEINRIAAKILGKEFIRSEDEVKLKTLTHYAWKEYTRYGIANDKSSIEAEKEFQTRKFHSDALIKMIPFEEGKDTSHWMHHHKVKAPFIRYTVRSRYKDKDMLLSMLGKSIKQGKIHLSKEIVILTMPGCDNNEAGTKLQLFLETELGKKTHLIASDVSPDALSKTRGLAVFSRIRARAFGLSLKKSDIVVHDQLNPKASLKIPDFGQKIALPLRLGAIIPYPDVERVLRALIKSNDIILLSFLADTPPTQLALERNSFRQICDGRVAEIPTRYVKTLKEQSLCLWKKPHLIACLKKMGARIICFRKVIAKDDLGAKVTFFTCILQGSRL